MTARSLVRILTNRRGQALAEFALVMPILLFLVIGIIEFGRGWNTRQTLTDASREGARLAVVQNPLITQADVTDSILAKIQRNGLDPTTATVTYAGPFRSIGFSMTVTVSMPYQFVFLAPLINLFGGAQASTITLSATSTMRNE